MQNLAGDLQSALMIVLQALSESLNPVTFQIKNLSTEQRELFQSYLGSLIQILIAKLKGAIDRELTINIMNLVKALFEQNQKVIQGGLLIIHPLIYVNEGAIEEFIEFIGPSIVTGIKNYDDENCVRFAIGLISDLSNHLEKNMSKYSDEFMSCLNDVLKSNEL